MAGRGGARPGSGRPKGSTNKATRDKRELISELAREWAEDAVGALATIMQDGAAPAAARVSAATAILDRGFGRPVQGIDHSSSDGTMRPPTRIEIAAATITPPPITDNDDSAD